MSIWDTRGKRRRYQVKVTERLNVAKVLDETLAAGGNGIIYKQMVKGVVRRSSRGWMVAIPYEEYLKLRGGSKLASGKPWTTGQELEGQLSLDP